MKKILQKILAGLAVLVVNLGLFTSQSVNAAEIPSGDFSSQVRLTDATGNEILAGTQLKYDTEYKFNVDISLDDTVEVKKGDTLIVEVPDAFVILKTDTFTIYDAQGNPAGTAQKDPNSNKIIFTFNDYFEGLNENKKFGFEFNAQVSRRATNNTEIAPTDSFPIPSVITPPAQGIYPGEKIAK
ncbi:hypothetical protein HO422_03205 [Streptococcus suis]|nr:hypothetical protein [Streptococcus suis]